MIRSTPDEPTRWTDAEHAAAEQAVYDDLHRTARRLRARERPDLTMRTTGLVHEAYLALSGTSPRDLAGQDVSPALYAHTMRRVLVGEARRRLAVKRGSGVRPASLSDEAVAAVATADPRPSAAENRVHLTVDLDAALGALRRVNARACEVVEMKFFGDLDHDDIAEALGVSAKTVKRDWDWARSYLELQTQGWGAR